MKTKILFVLGWMLIGALHAADSSSRITPAMQSALDVQKKVVAGWATNPVLVAAVKAQNTKGPLAGMTNGKWKKLSPNDPLVQSFEKNAAAQWLAAKLNASKGVLREAFLSGAKGEKVAFVDKPSSYLHNGMPKFDQPMSGKFWEGAPDFDKSSASYVVQVGTPILSSGKPIGVLVVGISMKMMREMSR